MPSVSKAQNAAMRSAAEGRSTLGIPKSVGQDFVTAQHGHPIKGLPEHVTQKPTGNPGFNPLFGRNVAPTLTPKQKKARVSHHLARSAWHAGQALAHLDEGTAADHTNSALDALEDAKAAHGT